MRHPSAITVRALRAAARPMALAAIAASALSVALPTSLLGAPVDPGITVRVGLHPTGPPVPTNFLGLSFEGEAIPLLSRYGSGGTLGEFLRSLGPGVLRVGGVSADKSTAWAPAGTPLPPWASTAVTPGELAGIGTLAKRTGWSVLLTVNLGHYDPSAAAAEAASARAQLGEDLAGVELGNEPNAYVNEGLRPPGWDRERWVEQVTAYRHTIHTTAQSVPIAAPDVSSGTAALGWVRSIGRLRAHLLTDHFYSLTSCNHLEPTIAELTATAVRQAEAEMLARLRAIARASDTPLRIDETNSISCHGEPGVSNSFASALWAIDWTVRAMRAGLAGINFHDLLDEPGAYSPLVLTRGRLHANPEWYALLMAAQLEGEVPVSTASAGDPELSSAAFLGGAGRAQHLDVVLVNFAPLGTRPRLVRLRVPRHFTSGSILRLTGPSPAALSQVALGGGEVGASGAWRPKLRLPHVAARHGLLVASVPASSAALVRLTTGALR